VYEIDIVDRNDRLPLLSPVPVDEHRVRDRQEPGLAVGARLKSIEGPEGSQEGFLRDVPRIVGMAREAQGRTIHDGQQRHRYRFEAHTHLVVRAAGYIHVACVRISDSTLSDARTRTLSRRMRCHRAASPFAAVGSPAVNASRISAPECVTRNAPIVCVPLLSV
jgi:hypothetical protein